MSFAHNKEYIFTSESVSQGHPDKLCDQISDAILDACLAQDSSSRVAVETLATTNFVCISGEVTTKAKVDYEAIARSVIRSIGYTEKGHGFSDEEVAVDVRIHEQSPDISLGVTATTSKTGEQGAGDQGMMFGYACKDTNGIPATLYYSHKLMEIARRERMAGRVHGLLPDAKCQVSLNYCLGKSPELRAVVFSHQHQRGVEHEYLRDFAIKCVLQAFPTKIIEGFDWNNLLVNPTGSFVVGGPHGDTGLTGRKIIVDTYGGAGHHGGGAFSGKDPSKVDRSGAYFSRYVAKNLIAAGVADEIEIQIAYAIGRPQPVSLNIECFGTEKYPSDVIEKCVRDLFDFRPFSIERALSLRNPQGWSYQQTASGGHFGRDIFPWEKTDRAKDIVHYLNRAK